MPVGTKSSILDSDEIAESVPIASTRVNRTDQALAHAQSAQCHLEILELIKETQELTQAAEAFEATCRKQGETLAAIARELESCANPQSTVTAIRKIMRCFLSRG